MSDQNITPSISIDSKSTPSPSRIIDPVSLSPPRSWQVRRLPSAMWRCWDRHHQLAVNAPETGFRNIPVANIEEAISLALKYSDKGVEVYLACAEYDTPGSRTAANAVGARCFWLDIDVGEDKAKAGKGYATLDEAKAALDEFRPKTGLPNPNYVVNSGGGLHVYWVHDTFVLAAEWKEYARKLKALCKEHGLLADPSRTADIASVLRVPGTLNYKYDPPRNVTLLYVDSTEIAWLTMKAAIDSAYAKIKAPAPKAVKVVVPYFNRPFDSNTLRRLTSALRHIDPDCDELTWKLRVLAVLAQLARDYPEYAAALKQLAIDWSSGALRDRPSVKWTTPGSSNGRTGEEIFEEVWNRFLTEVYAGAPTTLGTIFHLAKESGWVDDVEAFEPSRIVQATEQPQPLSPEGFPHVKRNRFGEPSLHSTIENLEHLLVGYGIQARFNVVKKTLDISIPGFKGTPENYRSTTLTHIVSLATLNGIGTNQIGSYIEAIGDHNPINPAGDWITSRAWDGRDRLPDVYSTLITREDFPEALKHELIHRWLLSAVAAAMKEGFHCRGVLTLQGAQGLGKTSWFRRLINDPSLREDLLLLGHHLDVGNKDSQTTAICHWIVELGELDSSFKRDVARLKGFITATHDKIRRPYGRTDSEYPRRTVFCASVNEDTFLVDPTGNTRFWTLPVVAIDYNHSIDMQQVFAQLAIELNQGANWWLSPEMDLLLTEQNSHHTASSIVEEKVLAALDMDLPDAEWAYRSASEMLEVAGIHHPQNPQSRECGAVLRRLFGPPKKVQGIMKWRVPIAVCRSL